jgi:hypothetical protein
MLIHSNAHTLIHSYAHTLKRSNAQTLKRSNAQTLKRSNAHTLKRSYAQTLKRSNAQTLKRSNAHTFFSVMPAVCKIILHQFVKNIYFLVLRKYVNSYTSNKCNNGIGIAFFRKRKIFRVGKEFLKGTDKC